MSQCPNAAAAFHVFLIRIRYQQNSTDTAQLAAARALAQYDSFLACLSALNFAEACTLLCVCAAFVACGYVCRSMINRLLSLLVRLGHGSGLELGRARQAGEGLNRRILATVAAVFCTFMLRTSYSLFGAVVQHTAPAAGCEGYCARCQPTNYVIAGSSATCSLLRALSCV